MFCAWLFENRLALTLVKNIMQGFCFSRLKVLPLLSLLDNLKAAKVKLLIENNLLESTPLWIKRELKIDANPGLA